MSKLLREAILRACSYSGVNVSLDDDVVVDFHKAKYRIFERENEDSVNLVLIPESMDFLSGLAPLFPFSNFDFEIEQHVCKERAKQDVWISLNAIPKRVADKKVCIEDIRLSDEDFDYLISVYEAANFNYVWNTAQDYLKENMCQYLEDSGSIVACISDKAYKLICEIVHIRYMEFKIDGYVDYDDGLLDDTIRNIVEGGLAEHLKTIGVNPEFTLSKRDKPDSLCAKTERYYPDVLDRLSSFEEENWQLSHAAIFNELMDTGLKHFGR